MAQVPSASAALHDLPATHRAWACAFMLRDLARRYSADELTHVADALDEATAASGDLASPRSRADLASGVDAVPDGDHADW
jgi:hypothetical protein